jgi:hypothetical protein
MDNIKHRLEFIQNENVDITNFSQTEVMTIAAIKNIANVPLESRFYILATMQNALRIDFADYKNFYADWLEMQKDVFNYIAGTKDI